MLLTNEIYESIVTYLFKQDAIEDGIISKKKMISSSDKYLRDALDVG